MDEPELLTVSQAAEALSATSQTIRNWIRSGRINATRIGNRFLIPQDEVTRLRGDLSSLPGESNWAHEPDQPPQPLARKGAGRGAEVDPTEGLLGV
jgi:excisionase family DNA binding protein